MEIYEYECPICKTKYDRATECCQCGFEHIEKSYYDSAEMDSDAEKKELFNIYKFTKRVACGEIPYEPSELELIERDDKVYVYEALEKRGLAYIDCVGKEGIPTVADMGVIALRTGLKSLILNTDEADSRFLDEGHIRMLFLGPDFKRFTDGYIVAYAPIRYLWVNSKNKFFSSEDNVLFNKNKTELIFYPRYRPETEYRVPSTVKKIGKGAFGNADKLKKIYLPKNVSIEDRAITKDKADGLEIVFY